MSRTIKDSKKAPLCKGGWIFAKQKDWGIVSSCKKQSLRHFLTKMPPPFTQGRLKKGLPIGKPFIMRK